MNPDRFDTLSRLLSGVASRRRMLRALAATAAGSSLALLGLSEPADGRRKRCQPRCGPGMRCVRRQCVVGQGTCPNGADTCAAGAEYVACAPQQQEVEENCQCLTSTEGQTRCADSLAIDEKANCGQCASSDQCKKIYPNIPGVFCAKVSGKAGACCEPAKRGFCMAPCPAPSCTKADDCPDPGDVCIARTCSTNGRCGKAFVADGTPLPNAFQSSGDCRVEVCDGHGDTRFEPDDDDAPTATECITGECDNGQVVTQPPGTPCEGGAKECDSSGRCVEPEP
jgi:hypothetical protein